MPLKLWLAQPEMEQRLAAALRLIVVLFVFWGGAVAYGLWSTRSAIAASQAQVISAGKKLTDTASELPRKKIEAANAARVKTCATPGTASADLADELSRISLAAGTEIAGVRIGDGGQAAVKSSPAAAPSETPSNNSASAPPAAAPAGDDQETFECNISGEYSALTQFLKLLAESYYVLDVTDVEVTRANLKTGTDKLRLEMKLSGIVYETPVKS